MKKWGAVLVGLAVLAIPFVLMAAQQQEIDGVEAYIAGHDILFRSGKPSSVETIEMNAGSNYSWHFYIENQGIVTVHLLADVSICLANGTEIVNITLDDSEYSVEFLYEEMAEGPQISYETEVFWRSTTAMNATINITCHDVGFWRYHVYENLRSTIFSEYDVLQKVLGINTMLIVLAVIILALGFLHVAARSKHERVMPERPWLHGGKDTEELKHTFAASFEKMLAISLSSQGAYPNTFAGQMSSAYQRYVDILARIKASGLKCKLHPKNGLTIASEPTDEEQSSCKELVDLAQQCNHIFQENNALWIVIVFMLGIYAMAIVIELGRFINVGNDPLVLYTFVAVLAGLALFLVVSACKVIGKGTQGPFPRSLLLLDPLVVERLHDQGIYFPFADLAIHVEVDEDYIKEMARFQGGARKP
jgi:hypothetical protein